MKKIMLFAIASLLTISAFAKTGDCKNCTKKHHTAECKTHCTKAQCAAGVCK